MKGVELLVVLYLLSRRSSAAPSTLPPAPKPKGWEGPWPPPEGEDNLGRHPLPEELDR